MYTFNHTIIVPEILVLSNLLQNKLTYIRPIKKIMNDVLVSTNNKSEST